MYRNGFIDFKKPSATQNDYRTSTYRGLIRIPEDVPRRTERTPSNICERFVQHISQEEPEKSEQRSQYLWKAGDPYVVRNPPISLPKYMRLYGEAKLRNVPKLMTAPRSIYKSDFQCISQAYEAKQPIVNILTPVEFSKHLCINPIKPGCAKLLNPSATTKSLSYLAYTTQELGIATKDNITLWNWKKEKKNVFRLKQPMCDRFNSAECPKRRCEFKCSTKYVPNGGLTTESGSNYALRLDHRDIDFSHIKNKFVSYRGLPYKADAESKIYGSGKLTLAYVS